jgi:hypothetical protein
MPSERKAFALRLDPALHDAIARLANADLRSVNAEIEFLLREALRARGVKLNETSTTEDNSNNGGE